MCTAEIYYKPVSSSKTSDVNHIWSFTIYLTVIINITNGQQDKSVLTYDKKLCCHKELCDAAWFCLHPVTLTVIYAGHFVAINSIYLNSSL